MQTLKLPRLRLVTSRPPISNKNKLWQLFFFLQFWKLGSFSDIIVVVWPTYVIDYTTFFVGLGISEFNQRVLVLSFNYIPTFSSQQLSLEQNELIGIWFPSYWLHWLSVALPIWMSEAAQLPIFFLWPNHGHLLAED